MRLRRPPKEAKNKKQQPLAAQLDNPYRPIYGPGRSLEQLVRQNQTRRVETVKKQGTALVFSPTGSTAQVAQAILQGIGGRDFCDLTVQGQPLCFDAEQLVVVAVPVFGGRVPATAVERLRQLSGNGALAAAVVVYGNRAYEDAMLELAELLTQQGFSVIGGAAFVARHSIVPAIASGRPNREDLDTARDFGRALAEKSSSPAARTPVRLPGSSSYRLYNGMAAKPMVLGSCAGCGICADACPTGAISKEAPAVTDPDRCITCMRCVTICPNGARSLVPEVQDAMAAKLARVCAQPQKNEVYL